MDGVVDLPFAVSPVVAGLMLVVLYGPEGWLGGVLGKAGIQVIYAVPGMIAATVFVTVPFVVRELVPILRELGEESEQAAYTLGAGRWRHILERHAAVDSLGRGLRGDAHGRAVAGRIRRRTRRFGQPDRHDSNRNALHPRRHRELSHRGRLCGQPGAGCVVVRVARGNGNRATAAGRTAGESDMSVVSAPLDRSWDWPGATLPWANAATRARHASKINARTHKEASVAIAVRNLSKRYGTFQAVDNVSFDVPAGQLVALLGPSGSGKSTILRMIAGLETAETGAVELTGEDATAVPIQHRGVGFVFQHYALFRHMTVRENIAFGLQVRKVKKAEIRERVDALLDLVQLSGYAARYPSQLSGGQRQRVALARRSLRAPRCCCSMSLSERSTRRCARNFEPGSRRLHDEVHVTSLFVTHDQQEAFEVADQVVVLNRGRVEQMGPPQELYEKPKTPFVTSFLGTVNVLRGQTASGVAVLGEGIHVPTEIDGHDLPVSVYIRPHDLDLRMSATASRLGRGESAGSHRWERRFGWTSSSTREAL